MAIKYILNINILLTIFTILLCKDVNTFSNYEQIKQTNLEINFNIDFTQKVAQGKNIFLSFK